MKAGAMILRIGISIVAVWANSVCADKPFPDRILIDFDSGFEARQLVVDEGRAAVVPVKGNNVLELQAGAGERVKIRLFPKSGNWNLKEYVNLAVDFENAGEDEAWFRMLIKDADTKNESWYRPNLSHNGWVKPGETRVFPALLVRHKYKNKAVRPDYMDRFPKMHGLPHAQMLVWFGIDVTQVAEVVISLEPKPYAQVLRIDNIRGSRRASPELLETDPDAFFPFIDVYGQYMHEEWPGKVHSDADLVTQKKAEEEDLAANPRPKAFNKYGGWKDGPTFKATGHFRVEKMDGKWWFIDPEGKLFWSAGCTSVGRPKMKLDLSTKRHFYHGLPDPADPVYESFYSRNGNDYESMSTVLYRKYGEDFKTIYNEIALRRMRSWGMNTLGAWSEASLGQPERLKMPYTWVLWVPETLKPVHKLHDPFDPGFEEAVKKAVRRNPETINDPYCIGYFCNNEIHWGKDPLKVVKNILACGEKVHARQEAVRHIAGRGGDPSNPRDDDLLSFYRHLLDTYYRRTRAAIKSVAPNKLYLGSRIFDGSFRKEVASASAAHCDVVSINVYEKDVDQFNVRDPRDLPFFPEDKPFLVGEFDFGALDRGKFFTGIGFAVDQRNRGENYIHYMKSALRNPRCVGAHWFNYVDSATGSRYHDAENANGGLISSTDSPYPEMVKAMRSVGQMMYDFRDSEDGVE